MWSAPAASCDLRGILSPVRGPVRLCVERGVGTDTALALKEPTVGDMMLAPKEGWPMVGWSKGHWGSFQEDVMIL